MWCGLSAWLGSKWLHDWPWWPWGGYPAAAAAWWAIIMACGWPCISMAWPGMPLKINHHRRHILIRQSRRSLPSCTQLSMSCQGTIRIVMATDSRRKHSGARIQVRSVICHVMRDITIFWTVSAWRSCKYTAKINSKRIPLYIVSSRTSV